MEFYLFNIGVKAFHNDIYSLRIKAVVIEINKHSLSHTIYFVVFVEQSIL